ncbi:hypothetical protein B0H10DRAFT_2329234 [Mycena sp. CBHHK59/15]|nr:hypothetical protein B0H10DRAFT_2329234 [Mycena sp. CBHHK59/15]
MNHIPDALSKIQDPRLWTRFITHVFNSSETWASDMTFLNGNSETLITEAQKHFSKFNDPGAEEYAESRSINANVIRDVDESQYDYALGLHEITCIDILIDADDIEVQRNLDISYVRFSTMGDTYMMKHSDVLRAELYLRQGKFLDAKALFQTCYDASWGKDGEIVDLCLDRLGDLACWGPNKTSWTSSWTIIFLAHALKQHKKLQIHQALRCLGDVFLDQDDLGTALSLFIVALEGFEQMDVHRSKGDCMLRLGDISNRNGDFNKAAEFYRGALPLFERSLQAKSVSQINARLAAIKQSTSEAYSAEQRAESGIERDM